MSPASSRKFLQKREHMLESVQDLLIVDDMHERKRLMFEKADAFVALPGGIGTLEELVEQLTWVQLERHDKPVLIADIGGFWRPLLALLEHMREQGFIRPHCEARYLVCERVEDDLADASGGFRRKRRSRTGNCAGNCERRREAAARPISCPSGHQG